jgi:hypothetical protein
MRKLPQPVMMIASERLKVVPLTVHLALREVPRVLSYELVLNSVGDAACRPQYVELLRAALRANLAKLGEDSHGETVLSVRAEGDLDGDGVLSLFERSATIQHGELALDPLLTVRDRVE